MHFRVDQINRHKIFVLIFEEARLTFVIIVNILSFSIIFGLYFLKVLRKQH